MRCTRSQPVPRHIRAAISLVEILVVIGIMAILFGAILSTGKVARDSRRQATAQQQLAMIAAAIHRYAESWPPWKIGNLTIADKGWPDFIAGRQFPGGVFSVVAAYNDPNDPYAFSFSHTDFSRSVPNANSCLVYCLRSPSGRNGPLNEAIEASAKDIRTIFPGLTEPNYPAGTAGSTPRELFVDSWGRVMRYFWVYRDSESNPAMRAYNGYLPVDCGPAVAGAGTGGIDATYNLPGSGSTTFLQSNGSPKRAVGFVLESAGPDGKFGNVWKVNPTAIEISDARDNLTVKP